MSTITRKVYRIDKAGNIKNLKKVQEQLKLPQEDQVLVKVKTIGLNFADIFAILGLYSATPKGSFVPGLEFCGIVEQVGPLVESYQKGDRVMGVTRFGGYATHVLSTSDYLTPLPAKWSFEEGAGYLVQGLTAYYGLFNLGNLQPRDTVLIHSAAGGVGLLANRMAKKMSAYTIGTIGSPSKIELLKKEGYDAWIVRGKDFKKKLQQELDGRELNIVMECIGGKIFKEGFELLSPQGRLINYGSARYGNNSDSPNWLKLAWKYTTRPRIDPQGLIESNKAILGFNLIWLYHKKELMNSILKEMDQLKLSPPHIGHVLDFDALPEAIKLFQSGKTMGKVVVKTD